MTQRKPLKTPTPRQKKAAQLLVENGSSATPKPIGQIMKEAGYSNAIATAPSKVTRSEGFLAVLEAAGVTDDKLAIVLTDGLEASDLNTRHKYLETGLRLKGHGKSEGGMSVTFNNVAQAQRNDYQLS